MDVFHNKKASRGFLGRLLPAKSCDFEDNPTALTSFETAEVFLCAAPYGAHHYRSAAHSPFLQKAKFCQIGLRCGKLRFPLRELLLKIFSLFAIPSTAEGSLLKYPLCVIPSTAEGSLLKYPLCVIPSVAEGSEPNALKVICSQSATQTAYGYREKLLRPIRLRGAFRPAPLRVTPRKTLLIIPCAFQSHAFGKAPSICRKLTALRKRGECARFL